MVDQRDTFNSVAAEYAAVRPAYPKELFDDLAGVVGGAGEKVLEIGCGSGQATQGLLDYGWEVVAVDPGDELVALAKARVAGKITFHVMRFEAFNPQPASFRLVASAQAWHWVDPTVSFPKAAAALAPGGWLAIFGHVPMPPPRSMRERLEPIYREFAPDLWRPPPQVGYLPDGPLPGLVEESGLFGPVTHRGYAWSERVSAEGYVRQLRTRSDYNLIERDRRDRLLEAIETALTPLGEMPLSHETHLYRAPVRA